MSRFPESSSITGSEKSPAGNQTPEKKKKLGRFVATGPAGEKAKQADTEEKSPPSKSFSEALADSLIKREDKEKKAPPHTVEAKKSDTEVQVEARDQGESAAQRLEQADAPERSSEQGKEQSLASSPKTEIEPAAPEADNAEATDEPIEYKEMFDQKLKDNQVGTEFVVNLDGNVSEHVVSLRDNNTTEKPLRELRDQPPAAENPYPAFSRQPEQQHQARPEQAPAPVAAEIIPPVPEAGAGGGGEVPPVPPPEQGGAGAEQPEPNRQPEQPEWPQPIYPPLEIIPSATREMTDAGGGASYVNPSAPRAGERPATKQEVEDALYRSAQIHEQRGVLSGLLFGTWFANRRLRRRQLRETKELQRQGKQLEQLSKQSEAATIGQESDHANTERRFANVEKRFENPSRPEKAGSGGTPERAAAQTEQVSPNEQLAIPQDHRLETSAWHTIEVDNKTGKPVEAPAFEYGHEYYRERAQETGPREDREAATGSAALSAAAQSQPADSQPNDDSQQKVPNATSQGPPKSAKEKAKSALGMLTKSDSQAGPIWPWLVALLVIVILLRILL